MYSTLVRMHMWHVRMLKCKVTKLILTQLHAVFTVCGGYAHFDNDFFLTGS